MRAPLLFLAAVLAAACSSSCSSSTTQNSKTPPAPPAPDAAPAALDEGVLKINMNGEAVGEETFKVMPVAGGRREYSAQGTWKLGGNEMKVDSDLVTDEFYRPESGSVKIVSKGKTSEMTLSSKDGVLEATTPDGKDTLKEKEHSHLFIHDRVLSQWAPLCAIGETEGKEIKVFPGVDLQLGRPNKREIDGKTLVHHGINVGGGAVLDIVCEGPRMVLFAQAAAKLVAARPGFEALAAMMAQRQEWKPPTPAGVQDLERQVRTNDNVLLGCSLMVPAERRSPLPAVVMLTGSGAQDRDEDSPGGRPVGMAFYKHIAIALAKGGIASLRCDDRGIGKSSGSMAKITLDLLVADAIAQVGQLRAEPGIDPKRIGLIGHSEGGLVAAIVGVRIEGIRAIALLASLGRNLSEVSLDQRDDAFKQMGLTDVQRAEARKEFGEVYAAIEAGKPLPDGVPEAERKALEPILPYLASHFRVDVAKTFSMLKMPVLVARGGKDFQVSDKDVKAILAALKKGRNKRVVVKPYPELSHMFAPSKTGTVADYGDQTLSIDLAFIGDVVTFLAGIL